MTALVAIWRFATSRMGKEALFALAIATGLYVLYHHGEKAGAAKVEAKVEKAHAAAITDARHDERAAANASATIATSTAQQTIASAAVTHYIVKELHDAIDAVPPAAPGAALPAAPVDSLRASLNTGIAGANRAADAADAIS